MMQTIRVATVKPQWISTRLTFDGGLHRDATRHRSPVTSLSCLRVEKDRNIHCSRVPNGITSSQDESHKNTLIPIAFAAATFRNMHLSPVTSTVTTKEPSFLWRTLMKLGFPDPEKYRRKAIGHFLYEDIVNNVNYSSFFKDFKLPDTFYSWFVIMELHVWMLMVRYMAEGKLGQEIRNSIVEAMWTDVNRRKSQLKNANVSALKSQVQELSQQFNAAIIGYDEGIMSDDKVLAGALWRRFFQCECNNPEYLEKLIVYVRKQVNELDKMSSEECMVLKSTQWIKYDRP